jgi:hypothetical protein
VRRARRGAWGFESHGGGVTEDQEARRFSIKLLTKLKTCDSHHSHGRLPCFFFVLLDLIRESVAWDVGCGAWGFESHGGGVTEDSRTGREFPTK